MKITAVRVIVTCPAGQTYTLLKVAADAGVYGVGEGTKNGRELAVAAPLEHQIAPALTGRDPGASEEIWQLRSRGAPWRGGPIQRRAPAPSPRSRSPSALTSAWPSSPSARRSGCAPDAVHAVIAGGPCFEDGYLRLPDPRPGCGDRRGPGRPPLTSAHPCRRTAAPTAACTGTDAPAGA